MTDIEVFKKFMGWMKMDVDRERNFENGDTLLIFSESGQESEQFTTQGYDDFDAGIFFDKDGNMIKGYIDSHVAYVSTNAKILYKMILNL